MDQIAAAEVVSPDRPIDRRLAMQRSQLSVPAAADVAVLSGRQRLPTLSCVVPCYNEAANLMQLLPELRRSLGACSRAWEVIAVDDGSTDATALVLEGWARRPGFRMLQLSRNFGKEAALTAGLRAAGGEVVVLMDADLQHSPSLIPTFVGQWQAGHDVVYAVREDRRDENAWKRLGANWFYKLVNAADHVKLPPGASDFRLLDRSAVDALLSLTERNRFMKGLYAWVGFDTLAVPYTPAARAHGRSRFRPLRLLHLSIDGLTAFTTLPLRAVSIVGFTLALLAFVYGGFLTVNHWLYGNPVSGWTTIVVCLLLLSGIQLISLGIVGEYVGRVFEEVKARPLFIVKRALGRGLAP